MIKVWIYLIYFILSSYFNHCFAAFASRDEVAAGGRAGNPGVRSFLSQKGVNYLNLVSGDIINAAIPSMPIPDNRHDIPLGYIELSDLHIVNFRPADRYDIELKSPNVAMWMLNNMDIGMKGHANFKYLLTKGDGNFDLTGYNTDFEITLLVTNDNGHPHLEVRDCRAKSRSMDINIYDFRPNIMRLFENHRQVVLRTIKPRVEKELCKQLRTFMSKKVNEELQKLPMKEPLNKNQYSLTDGTRFADASSFASTVPKSKAEAQLKDMLSKLFFDYALTQDPYFQYNTANLDAKGEISYMGQGNTPFYPNPLDDSSIKVDRMLYLLVADYVINSMTYHAFQNNLLNFNINKRDYPEFAMIFKPSCNELAGEFCLSSVLPQLNDQYPNYDMEIQTNPTQAPAIIIKNGKSYVYAPGEMRLVANKGFEHVEVIKMAYNTEAEMRPYLDNNMMKGNMTITKLQIQLLKSTLKDFNQDRVNSISDILKIVVETIGNALISKGFPLPTLKEVRLINPKLRLLDRKALIETDLDVNKDAVIQLAQRMAIQMGQSAVNDNGRGSRRIGR